MKTLGICIPTYRRPEFLKRCVLSAIESAEGRPVRIFIADDSANDVNDATLGQLAATYPFVHVHKNPSNLGLDNNIQRSVDLCDCDYAWMIGEDDVFLPGAVAQMHALVQTVDLPFVFANYAYVGDDPGRPLGQALNGESSGPLAADRFVALHLWAAGFLGACVVRRADWGRTDPGPYATTYYTHVGRIVEMVSDAGFAWISADCSVANRVEGDDTFTWKNDSYGVFFGFLSMCRTAAIRRPALSAALHAAGRALERRYRWLSIRVAARLRSQRAYDYGQYRKYLSTSDVPAMKKFVLLAVSVTPPSVFEPLVRAYRARRRSA